MGWLEAVVVVLGMICVVGLVVLGLLLMFLLDILMLGLLFPELLLLFAVFVWPGLKDKEEFKKMLQELEEKQKENKDKL